MTTTTRTAAASPHQRHLSSLMRHLRQARRSLARLLAAGPEGCHLPGADLDRDSEFQPPCWRDLQGINWALSVATGQLAGMCPPDLGEIEDLLH